MTNLENLYLMEALQSVLVACERLAWSLTEIEFHSFDSAKLWLARAESWLNLADFNMHQLRSL